MHHVCLAFIAMSLAFASAALADAPARPNIVLVMADDQGWGDTGYNGHPVLRTPHLDEMASKGLRFDRFYAAAPVCSPTRASVLTGRHPNRMGVFKWGWPIRPQEVTIAEALKKAGYTTGHFGKWHLGSVRAGSPVNPGASGYDTWLSAENFYDNDPILSREGKATPIEGESSMIAADAAIAFMRDAKAAGKPFLAVVWFGSPHDPHRAAPQDKALYPGEKEADWLGEITGLDRAVGSLRAALREMGIVDNTIVWYCSDNGGLLNASAGGRARKGSIYEGGLRVPAIIEWPARIRAPRTTATPVTTSDIYPTLLAITGVKVDPQPSLDGVNVLPLFDGGDMTHPPIGFWDYPINGISAASDKMMRELLEAQSKGQDPDRPERLRLDAGKIEKKYATDAFPGHSAWLDWPWKLHRIQKGENVAWELYNLADDPGEAENIVAETDQKDRVESMRDALEMWLASVAASLNGADYPSQ